MDLAKLQPLKEICERLNCYKVNTTQIITRCIYCGDSRKRLYNHGHFYIARNAPFTYCFRCGLSYNFKTWLIDLKVRYPDLSDKIDLVLNYVVKSQVIQKENLNQLDKINTNKDNLKVEKVTQLLKRVKNLKNFLDIPDKPYISKKLLKLLKVLQLKNNVDYFSDFLFFDEKNVYVVSTLGFMYLKRDLRFKTKFKKEVFHKRDLFIFSNAPLNQIKTIYIVEGIMDALYLFNFLPVGSAAVSSLGVNYSITLLKLVKYFPISYNKIIYIFDNDVSEFIYSNQIKKTKDIMLRYNLDVDLITYKPFLYKDIADLIYFEFDLNNTDQFLVEDYLKNIYVSSNIFKNTF